MKERGIVFLESKVVFCTRKWESWGTGRGDAVYQLSSPQVRCEHLRLVKALTGDILTSRELEKKGTFVD